MTAGRLSPAGQRYSGAELSRIVTHAAASEELSHRLALRLGAHRVRLFRSGREAMRVGLEWAAARSGRSEVLLPAYTCYSVAASAVAAGLRIRLVDVDARGRIDLGDLAKTPLDDVAAMVVCNLFGRAEPMGPIERIAGEAGCWVLDDAAQAFGAMPAADGPRPVGGRGQLGLLSFGRGKPLSGLGGGALILHDEPGARALPPDGTEGRPLTAAARAVAYNVARSPMVFSMLARIPALGIGETHFDPAFDRGGIDPAALVLTDVALDAAAAAAQARVAEAERLSDDLKRRTPFVPIEAERGETAVFPRLVMCAPEPSLRNRALEALEREGAGGSRMYPESLSRLRPLDAHRVDSSPKPGAENLADRILTLPVHGDLAGPRWDAALSALARLS